MSALIQNWKVKWLIAISAFILMHTSAYTQWRVTVTNPEPIDSINLSVSKTLTGLLEKKNISKAITHFRFNSAKDRKMILQQLERISKEVQPISKKTKKLYQTSYKNYKDSFNVDQVIYYNESGVFYLYELFYLKGDADSKIVEIYVKDPVALEQKRKAINDFKKNNPAVPQPPDDLPPGFYIKPKSR